MMSLYAGVEVVRPVTVASNAAQFVAGRIDVDESALRQHLQQVLVLGLPFRTAYACLPWLIMAIALLWPALRVGTGRDGRRAELRDAMNSRQRRA
ncbi:MAG: hypothetical protein A2W31_16175 [Planctomycetes bacterium RBG_16_64_10]|nr:MAG: hypothetical protein A2W31_16175 [Planctomycetes bacterium RBG_16_64_10]